MAVDKLVDSTALDTSLTAIADAIRAKTGGISQLVFPTGFVSEIGNIPSGGGSDSVIVTAVLENSAGDVNFGDVLTACKNANYEISYPESILFFRAKGTNAYEGTTSNTFNNFYVLVKNWLVWNKDYCRCRYTGGKVAPDSFGGNGGVALYESNNALNGAGMANIIDANHKIDNTYSGNAIGGAGTTVTLYEIPVNWSDFSTTLT